MSKKITLMLLMTLVFSPEALLAISEGVDQARKEIDQVWVDRHNGKLAVEIPRYVKGIRVKPHVYFFAPRHRHSIASKKVRGGIASKYGIPLSVKTSSGTIVPMVSLRFSKADGQSFLTADYADEIDARHSSSDIYIKIGLQYKHLFHGNGYHGCARLISLGKGVPVFFEVSTYGGGSRCDRTYYRLDTDALKAKDDELFDHPELIDVQNYVKQELQLNVWLEGYTLYKDLERNGILEIINTTDVLYPPDLKTKVMERYQLVDNDFMGPFRRATSIYKWNMDKSKFDDLGDYYHN